MLFRFIIMLLAMIVAKPKFLSFQTFDIPAWYSFIIQTDCEAFIVCCIRIVFFSVGSIGLYATS